MGRLKSGRERALARRRHRATTLLSLRDTGVLVHHRARLTIRLDDRAHCRDGSAVVSAVIEIANALQLTMIAEGARQGTSSAGRVPLRRPPNWLTLKRNQAESSAG